MDAYTASVAGLWATRRTWRPPVRVNRPARVTSKSNRLQYPALMASAQPRAASRPNTARWQKASRADGPVATSSGVYLGVIAAQSPTRTVSVGRERQRPDVGEGA